MIHKRVTLATITGLTAALALTACGGAKSDTALNTAGGQQVAPQDYTQANPEAVEGQAKNSGGDVSAADGSSGNGSDSGSDNGSDNGSGDDAKADGGSADVQQAGVVTEVLKAKKTQTMGTIVQDGAGRTLYRFDSDKKGAASTCNGECAVAWPPILTEQAPELKGVDPSLISKIKRDDGTEQITLNGWPLYRYAKDKTDKDWKGHGVKGVWWAITNTGGKAEKCLPSAQPSPADDEADSAADDSADSADSGGSADYSY